MRRLAMRRLAMCKLVMRMRSVPRCTGRVVLIQKKMYITRCGFGDRFYHGLALPQISQVEIPGESL